jgi:cytochrome c553
MSRRMSRHVALGLLALLAACNQAPVPGLARGEELYTTCAKCHGALGAGDQSLGAPAIGGLPAWYVQAQIEGFKIGHRGYDPFDTAGIRMKSISWGTTVTTVCATCHGPNAGGNPDVHAPPLAGRSDWYLHSQLQKFKSGARGAQPNDIWGATMRAQAMMLDDSTMSNVVAYIQSLRGNGSTP